MRSQLSLVVGSCYYRVFFGPSIEIVALYRSRKPLSFLKLTKRTPHRSSQNCSRFNFIADFHIFQVEFLSVLVFVFGLLGS